MVAAVRREKYAALGGKQDLNNATNEGSAQSLWNRHRAA